MNTTNRPDQIAARREDNMNFRAQQRAQIKSNAQHHANEKSKAEAKAFAAKAQQEKIAQVHARRAAFQNGAHTLPHSKHTLPGGSGRHGGNPNHDNRGRFD